MKTTDMILQMPQQIQGDINFNHLDDIYTMRFTKSDQGIVIELINKELHFSRELAQLSKGKWSYIAEERFQEMWNIMKTHKKVHKMFKKFVHMDIYASFNKQISCGRRRFNIAITRMFHKLTK